MFSDDAQMVWFYTHPDFAKCSAGGLSERYTKGVLCRTKAIAEKELKELRELASNDDMCVLYVDYRGGRPHARPIEDPDKGCIGWMAGGSFCYTSDARYADIAGQWGPIKIHDRQETQEVYDRLSR